MLMLIVRILFLYFYQVHFNTSHVNVNLMLFITSLASLSYFNTSHVNVNQRSMGYKRIPKGISIHLMLMLILGFQLQQRPHNYFNTSHVNVNQDGISPIFIYLSISIHLMLMLILCYKAVTRQLIHFNTSHVNVNRCAY